MRPIPHDKENTIATFMELGLSEKTLNAVAALDYTEPTPVQEQAIPFVLEGRDVIAAAKTGTGKTAAFALPCMDQLPHRAENEVGPFMLVITPTRELANQIAETCMPIGKHTRHFVGVFVGGVAYEPQIKKLDRGLDVAIATPGRLIDLMERGAIDLSSVKVLILDEADRMLDMGFWPQVERIVSSTPEDRQTMLFSATIDRSQDQTMFSILNDPAIVEIAQRGETADKVDQYIISTTRRQKPELLNCLIKEKGGSKIIVFTKTKGCADNCTRRLRRIGIPTDAIHADRSQAQRSRALDDFRNGKINVIVATDVLARGIDVTEVDYVVNYDLPIMPEDYVHRIGRTGRAGESGFAVSFVTPDTRNLLRSIQKFIGSEIEAMDFTPSTDPFEPIDDADPRIVAQAKRELEERHAANMRRRGLDGSKDGKKGKKKKLRQRDVERTEELKKKREAEAAGIEYVPPKREKPAEKPKKRTLAERQAAAEEAFNAIFTISNIPGVKKDKAPKKSKKEKGESTYSYEFFTKKPDKRDFDDFEEERKPRKKSGDRKDEKKSSKKEKGARRFEKPFFADKGFSKGHKSDEGKKSKRDKAESRGPKGGKKPYGDKKAFGEKKSFGKKGKGGYQVSSSHGKPKKSERSGSKKDFRPGRSQRKR